MLLRSMRAGVELRIGHDNSDKQIRLCVVFRYDSRVQKITLLHISCKLSDMVLQYLPLYVSLRVLTTV